MPTNFDFTPDQPIVNSQYTAIQIWVALDTWVAAKADYDHAIETIHENINSDWQLRSDAESTLIGKLQEIDDASPIFNPFYPHKAHIRRFSSERYPVAKALKDAATLRNSAKKILALDKAHRAALAPAPAVPNEPKCRFCGGIGEVNCGQCVNGYYSDPTGYTVLCNRCNGVATVICQDCKGTGKTQPAPEPPVAPKIEAQIDALETGREAK